MTKRLKVTAMVLFMLAMGTGTASASSKDDTLSIIINLDGVPRMVSTQEKTVDSLLATIDDLNGTNYTIEDMDKAATLSDHMVIDLTSRTEKMSTQTESIPFQTQIKETTDLKKGEEREVQAGVVGTKQIVTKEIFAGDDLVETLRVEEKIITQPVKRIVEKGVENQINGMQYAYTLDVKATGYTPYDPGCNGITATGTKAQRGVIAVDPRVIPMGTRVYIPGYGEAVAADTGGAIKGKKIDLCYETKKEAYNWGIRDVKIYILK